MGIWSGDTSKLDEIKKTQKEQLSSPYNTASVTEQSSGAYDMWAKELADAKLRAKTGLTEEEKALATSNYSQAVNLNKENALIQSGGQFAPYLNAVTNTGQQKFGIGLAAEDAAIKRQNQLAVTNYLQGLTGASGVYQDVNNMNFQKQMMAEQAAGQAESDWYSNRDANRRAIINAGAQVLGSASEVGGAALGKPPTK